MRFSFIVFLAVISTACLQAVVLPKTSYVDMPVEGVYDDFDFSAGSYVMSTSSFNALGTYESCTSQATQDLCESCCNERYDPYSREEFFTCADKCEGNPDCISNCENQYGANDLRKCQTACSNGASLPLDGGEWLLVVLGLLSTLVTILAKVYGSKSALVLS